MLTRIVAGIALLALVAPAAGKGAVLNVNCAHANLQAKINHAAAGSTLAIRGTCAGLFTISKSLKLAGDPTATLDGAGEGTTLTTTGGTVQLAHLVVKGGRIAGGVQAFGGGIDAQGTKLTLRHVVVRGNLLHATNDATGVAIAIGGGIISDGGSLTLVSSVVKGNTVTSKAGTAMAYAGGIYRANGPAKLLRSTVRANRVVATSLGQSALAQGGGLFVDESSLVVRSSHVERNVVRAGGAGGPTEAQGGAVYLSDAKNVTLAGSTLAGNRVIVDSNGTAADASGGALAGALEKGTFTRARLAGNLVHGESAGDATASGGAASVSPAHLTATLSHFVANVVEATGPTLVEANGGAFDVETGSLALQRSTVDGNSARALSGTRSASGGGLVVVADLLLSRSTVSRNLASGGAVLGGGIYLPTAATTASIENSTVARNRVSGNTARGGGIDTFVDLSLIGSTVAANGATIGGGIYREQGTTTLAATILGANSAPDSPQCSGPIESNGHNLIGSTKQCTFMQKPSDAVRGPKLGKLGHHGGPTETVSIGPDSPAFNAIPKAACPFAADQRGVKRPQGARCDIGAFELKR
jgi:hypothetical protein